MAYLIYILFASLFLTSCANLPPSVLERDPLETFDTPETWQVEQEQTSEIIDGLTDLFNDEKLDTLTQQILNNNLDVKLAYQQMQEAGFTTKSQRGQLFPELSANFNSNRAKQTEGQIINTTNTGLDVSWEVDLWGRVQSQNLALTATEQSRTEDYYALQNLVVAQGIQTWFDVVTNYKLVGLTEQRLSNLETRAKYSRRRFQVGLEEYDDLVAIERDIATTKSGLQFRIDALNIAARNLQLISGQYPSKELAIDYSLPSLLKPPSADLPANLLTQRPDLRAAWQEVVSADASVNVAHKELYPSLNLSGSIGRQSIDFVDFFSGSGIWSLASNIVIPLFNAGRLTNQVYENQSRAEQAWIKYLIAVQTAFNEVEQALDREVIFLDRETALSEALAFARKTESITVKRYQKGLVTILEYLDAQNTRFNIETDLITARNVRLQNRVALALALGKGV